MTQEKHHAVTRHFNKVLAAFDKSRANEKERADIIGACMFAAEQVANDGLRKALAVSIAMRCLSACAQNPNAHTADDLATVITDTADDCSDQLLRLIAKINNLPIDEIGAPDPQEKDNDE